MKVSCDTSIYSVFCVNVFKRCTKCSYAVPELFRLYLKKNMLGARGKCTRISVNSSKLNEVQRSNQYWIRQSQTEACLSLCYHCV